MLNVPFKGHDIRKIFHDGEWFFSIIDVVEALTDSTNPNRYWSDLKRQMVEKEGFSESYAKIVRLKLPASDGKNYETDMRPLRSYSYIAPLKMITILNAACDACNVGIRDLLGPSRFPHMVDARMYVAMALRSKGYPYAEIGRVLHRDRTTVRNLIDRAEKRGLVVYVELAGARHRCD